MIIPHEDGIIHSGWCCRCPTPGISISCHIAGPKVFRVTAREITHLLQQHRATFDTTNETLWTSNNAAFPAVTTPTPRVVVDWKRTKETSCRAEAGAGLFQPAQLSPRNDNDEVSLPEWFSRTSPKSLSLSFCGCSCCCFRCLVFFTVQSSLLLRARSPNRRASLHRRCAMTSLLRARTGPWLCLCRRVKTSVETQMDLMNLTRCLVYRKYQCRIAARFTA